MDDLEAGIIDIIAPKDGDLIVDRNGNVRGVWRIETISKEEFKLRYPDAAEPGD